jgi:hypothetical protein
VLEDYTSFFNSEYKQTQDQISNKFINSVGELEEELEKSDYYYSIN